MGGNTEYKVTEPEKKSHHEPNAQEREMFCKSQHTWTPSCSLKTQHQNNKGLGLGLELFSGSVFVCETPFKYCKNQFDAKRSSPNSSHPKTGNNKKKRVR